MRHTIEEVNQFMKRLITTSARRNACDINMLLDIAEIIYDKKPKKPIKETLILGPVLFSCDDCKEIILKSYAGEFPCNMPKFCQYCGTEIDWSKDE